MNTLKVTIIFLLSVSISLLAGCGGDDSPTGPPPTGTLEVTVTTTGDNPDFIGYMLALDGEGSQELNPNGTASFDNVEEGSYELELTEIFENCAVDGDNPRTINVTGESTTSVSINVSCTAVIENEDCLLLDPGNIEIDEESSTIIDGSQAVIDFDTLASAQKALDIIQFYGFNDQCFVDRPQAPMQYWLVGVAPPFVTSGTSFEEDCISLDPSNVEINEVDGQFQVADGSTGLLGFTEREEAEKALTTIQFYGFTQQCFVGRSAEEDPMQYWLR